MRIAILPLDERPVNTSLPSMVAAIAGAEVALPTREMLPSMRQPGDAERLASWLESAADSADALVVSLDMLAYGGLIASRTTNDRLDTVVRRLGALERIRAEHPALPVAGVTTVMRASHSYNAGEEPEYWSTYGVELHRLGGALHRRFLSEPNDLSTLAAAVPAEVRQDFLRRRLRNHTADLYAMGLAASGAVRPLVVTADDTAPRSAGSLEQLWISGWVDALELDGGAGADAGEDPGGAAAAGAAAGGDSATGSDAAVLCYPGADEVGATLTAAAVAGWAGVRPRIAALFPGETSGSRVAPYENVPVSETVRNQIVAAGATPASDPGDADAVLLVHPPEPGGRDHETAPDPAAPDPAGAVLDLLGGQPDGALIGLADVRQANGSDPALIDGLAQRGLVSRLAAYGGWNTAGNTIGSVLAALVAGVVGRRRGTHDPAAERRLLLHRLVEDYGYQAVVRGRLQARERFAGHVSRPFERPEDVVAYLAECVPQLEAVLAGFDRGWRLGDVRLPWDRAFEVDFTLTPVS